MGALDTVNLQPLLDLVGKAGEETSEFKKARAAGWLATVLFACGAIAMVGSAVAGAFGAMSKIGIACGALAGVAGVISNAIVSSGYSASRATVKAAAAQVVSDVVTAAAPPAKAA